MTDQEWQAGIEQALTETWRRGAHQVEAALSKKSEKAFIALNEQRQKVLKELAGALAAALPLRLALIYTRVDEIGKFRVGPARDEAAA